MQYKKSVFNKFSKMHNTCFTRDQTQIIMATYFELIKYPLLQFQDHLDGYQDIIVEWKNSILFFFSLLGAVLTLIEIMSYLILYHHLWNHNNKIVVGVVDANVIKMRNRANAISITGLFAGWIMEIWYLVLAGFLLFIVKDNTSIRQVISCVRMYEFFLIPLVQVYTSPPMKKFMAARQE